MKNLLFLLVSLIFSISSSSQNTVTGTVTDPKGRPVQNVSVINIRTWSSSTTNHYGYFTIEALDTDTLTFKKSGFVEERILVNYRKSLRIKLSPTKNDPDTTATLLLVADNEIEECVITVHGYQENMAMTGAVSFIPKTKMNFSFPDQFNTENYSTIHETGFKDVFNYPLSTFSVDVDRASYANVRRFLNMGQMPPVDAVRIEEMINYFDYNYEKPTENHPYSINSELSTCPWNKNHSLLLVGLQAKEIDKSLLPPSNLVFLIDVSGSMQYPNKLPLVKSAMNMLLNELRPNDRVAIVVYAGAAGVVLSSTSGNEKQKISKAIENLTAGGSTAGGAGLKLAYKIAHENFIEDGNNRIILATDGDFNVGVSSTSELERLVEMERESSIFLSVLGFGNGNYKDDRMETIADKGNGNYAYVDNMQEAQKVLVKEFGGTLFTVAKDVKLQLEFNPQHVKAYRLIGYENRALNNEDFKNDRKDAGEMGMGHTVTALYEIIPASSKEKLPEINELKYQKNKKELPATFSDELVTIKTRYKLPDSNTSIPFEQVVSSKIIPFNEASENIRFASAVAGFGMLLRNSDYSGNFTYDNIKEIANITKDNDSEGYRSEFIRLVKVAQQLASSHAAR